MVLYSRGVMEPIHANHTLQDFGPDDRHKQEEKENYVFGAFSQLSTCAFAADSTDFIWFYMHCERLWRQADRSKPWLGHVLTTGTWCTWYTYTRNYLPQILLLLFCLRRFLQRSVRAFCPCNCTAQVMIFWAATVPRHFSSSCVRYVQYYAYIIHT